MSEEELKEWKAEIEQQRIETQGEISQFVEGAELLFLIDKIFKQQKEIEELKLDRDYYKEMYYKIAFPEEEIRIKGLGVD